jgi:hypothetical protein
MSAPEKIVFLEGGENVDPDAEYQRLLEEATIEECALHLPRGYLSVSQVETYRRCPRQYMFQYVEGLRGVPSANMVEGTAVHFGLSVGHKESVKNPNVPLDVMLDAYNDSWKTVRKDVDWKQETEEDEKTIVSRDHIFLETYNRSFIPKMTPKVDERGSLVERRFWTTVGDMRVPLLGFIDLVARNNTEALGEKSGPAGSGEEEVIDHKVVGKMKSQEDADNDLQLSVYSHVTNTPRVRFQCFVKNKKPTIKTVASIRDAASWDWTSFVVQEIATCISKGIFPPGSPGWWCSKKHCGFWNICHGRVTSW